jgi:putative methyltransferase (TIGR04325 family)
VPTLLRAIFEKPTFAGHYKAFSDIPNPTGFDRKFAIERLDGAIKKPRVHCDSLLAILVSTIRPAMVLDFGGCIARGYREILAMSDYTPGYYLVEKPDVCAVIEYPIHVKPYIPEKIRLPCIVNVASSLQYVVNWKVTLLAIVRLRPSHIIIANTPVSNEATYVRCQINGRNRRIPCWVFNNKELIGAMGELGHKMVYSRVHPEKYKHKDAPAVSWYASMIFEPDSI